MKRENIFLFLGVAALACLIGYNSWRDMGGGKPSSQAISVTKNDLARSWLVLTDLGLNTPPPDNQTVLIWAGSAVTDKEQTTVIPALTPVNLPQREADLIFKLDRVPKDTKSLINKIKAVAESWKKKNNAVIDVYLDCQCDPLNLRALDSLVTTMRFGAQQDYWIGAVLKRAWLENDPAAQKTAKNMIRNMRAYIYDAGEAARDGETLLETLKKLNSFGVEFALRIDALPEPTPEFVKELRPLFYFKGFIPVWNPS